jgi:hypothetical protein
LQVTYTIPSTPSIKLVLRPSITNESLQAIHVDCSCRHKFLTPVNSAPKSFCKALFYGTSLDAAARRMSHAKVVPEGLKPQECERNVGISKPSIPYIPKKDVIQEAVDSGANMLKLTLPHKVELRVPLWSKGTPEQCLVHVQQARQKGL